MAHVVAGHHSPDYIQNPDTGLEIFVASNGAWRPILSKLDFAVKYSGPSDGVFTRDPPAWNTFKPTGYFNASLTQIPAKTFRMRFGEFIMSRAPIPPPA